MNEELEQLQIIESKVSQSTQDTTPIDLVKLPNLAIPSISPNEPVKKPAFIKPRL